MSVYMDAHSNLCTNFALSTVSNEKLSQEIRISFAEIACKIQGRWLSAVGAVSHYFAITALFRTFWHFADIPVIIKILRTFWHILENLWSFSIKHIVVIELLR